MLQELDTLLKQASEEHCVDELVEIKILNFNNFSVDFGKYNVQHLDGLIWVFGLLSEFCSDVLNYLLGVVFKNYLMVS